MSNIKFYRLVTGEKIIGELVITTNTIVVLKNVAWVGYTYYSNDPKQHDNVTKIITGEVELYVNNILYSTDVEPNLLKVYNNVCNPQ